MPGVGVLARSGTKNMVLVSGDTNRSSGECLQEDDDQICVMIRIQNPFLNRIHALVSNLILPSKKTYEQSKLKLPSQRFSSHK